MSADPDEVMKIMQDEIEALDGGEACQASCVFA